GLGPALEAGSEWNRGVASAAAIGVAQPRLHAVGAREPAEEVVERAVLHHEHDDVLDAGCRGVGQQATYELRARRRDDRAIAASERDAAGRGGGGRQERAARDG